MQYLHSCAMRTALSNVRLNQIYVALLACLFIMSCFDLFCSEMYER